MKQSSYGVLTAEVAFAFDRNWTARVWGRNLANSKYYSFVDASIYGDRGAAAAQLTLGAAVDFEF